MVPSGLAKGTIKVRLILLAPLADTALATEPNRSLSGLFRKKLSAFCVVPASPPVTVNIGSSSISFSISTLTSLKANPAIVPC